ncbi:MAG: hypothetical protein LUQ31_01060 [Methanoregula sp.]|nr:hypothetical protein [Methanoregula sp.]
MKTTLYYGSRKTVVDTGADECLYSAPRPVSHSSDVNRTGKDLYMHTGSDKDQITYYLHLWSTKRTVKDKIIPLPASMAERYLRGKGLTCDLFPKNDPVAQLYAWGYGIAEEF